MGTLPQAPPSTYTILAPIWRLYPTYTIVGAHKAPHPAYTKLSTDPGTPIPPTLSTDP